MVDGTKTARMTVDWHVVGRVGKGHRSTSLTHQLHTGVVVAGITAQDAMQAEKPQIAELAHTPAGRQLGHRIGRIGSRLGYLRRAKRSAGRSRPFRSP